MRTFIMAISALILITNTALAQYPNDTTFTSASGVEYYFGVDAFTYFEGAAFQFSLAAFNGGVDTAFWIFPTNQLYDLWLIQQPSGDTLWGWSWGKAFLGIVLGVIICPDSSFMIEDHSAFSSPWYTPHAGDYLLSGRWVPYYASESIPSLTLPVVIEPANAIERSADASLQLTAFATYPNPFNPTTAISYQLPAGSHVSLKVYNTAGRIVMTLVDGWKPAGTHQVIFDGSDLRSGIYLSRLTAGDFQQTQKLVLLK